MTQGSRAFWRGYSGIGAEYVPAGKGSANAELDPSLQRVWEVCQGEQVADVQGSLCKCIVFWEHELEVPSPILECIRVDYKLPLLSVPSVYYKSNAKSVVDNAEFVTTSIAQLLENCCIRKVVERPHVCSPLSVVTGSLSKKRLVLNLRYLNQFLFKENFKYEDLHLAMLLFGSCIKQMWQFAQARMAQTCLVAPRIQISWLSDWISSLRMDETVRLLPIVCCSKGLIDSFWPSGTMICAVGFGCGYCDRWATCWQHLVCCLLAAAHVLRVGGCPCAACW